MDAKKMIRIGAILLAAFALVGIIVSVINVNKSLSSMTNLTPQEAAAVNSQMGELGMDLESATVMVKAIAYGGLALGSIFSILKIIVGVLALKNTDRSYKFYQTWGIVFLVFGILGLRVGVISLLGLCNLASGIAGPLLFVLGANALKKQTPPQH